MILNTKKQTTFLVAVFICIACTGLSAQKSKLKDSTPEQRAKMQTEWMTTKLTLNASQVQQISALNLQYAQKNEPIIQSNDSKVSKFKKLKALQKEKSNALSQILSEEQYKKYEEIKDQMIQNFKNKRK
ncbi:hypothetical protein SAMN05421856_101148 [Chryseobacterium taichungense]|uniref:LTXXQ motif family protein n=1 Tax=Chryseobacterium taichungense TaxID=295069 RepID=A0A1H7VQC1_9FLAO|nr:hypothetical protein [Chryseobacterium taichungense]SEM11015.1 hypothetical protein SAMN05421856_101148 [Chryseobacterium taichungense]